MLYLVSILCTNNNLFVILCIQILLWLFAITSVLANKQYIKYQGQLPIWQAKPRILELWEVESVDFERENYSTSSKKCADSTQTLGEGK